MATAYCQQPPPSDFSPRSLVLRTSLESVSDCVLISLCSPVSSISLFFLTFLTAVS